MKNSHVILLFTGLMLAVTPSFAQVNNDAGESISSEAGVPGEQAKNLLAELQIQSASNEGASEDTIAAVVSALLTGQIYGVSDESRNFLETNQSLLTQLVTLFDENTTGFDLTIAGISLYPDEANSVAIIAMILFPTEKQEIYNVALQTGAFSSQEDALLALATAGVDVSELSATAAGGDDTLVAGAPDVPATTNDTTPGGGGDTISGN